MHNLSLHAHSGRAPDEPNQQTAIVCGNRIQQPCWLPTCRVDPAPAPQRFSAFVASIRSLVASLAVTVSDFVVNTRRCQHSATANRPLRTFYYHRTRLPGSTGTLCSTSPITIVKADVSRAPRWLGHTRDERAHLQPKPRRREL